MDTWILWKCHQLLYSQHQNFLPHFHFPSSPSIIYQSICPRSSPHYFTASYHLSQYIFITFLHLNLDHIHIYIICCIFILVPYSNHFPSGYLPPTINSIIVESHFMNLIKMGILDSWINKVEEHVKGSVCNSFVFKKTTQNMIMFLYRHSNPIWVFVNSHFFLSFFLSRYGSACCIY